MILSDSVVTVPYIGEKYAKIFAKLNIFTVGDLLYYFPTRHLNLQKTTTIKEAADLKGESALMRLTVSNKHLKKNPRFRILEITLTDNVSTVTVPFFNQDYLDNLVNIGDEMMIYGKVERVGLLGFKVTVSEFERIVGGKINDLKGIKPIYALTSGLSSKFIAKRIEYILTQLSVINEPIPQHVIDKNKMMSQLEAITSIHFPKNELALKNAKFRLGFDEIYLLLKRIEKEIIIHKNFETHPLLKCSKSKLCFGFELNSFQKGLINQLSTKYLNKTYTETLIQGDVGSGKTAVIAGISEQFIINKFDVCILCPTIVLATQLFNNFNQWFSQYVVKIYLITSENDKDIKLAINDQSPKILIGTHSLLFKNNSLFQNLGILVIDEQHKFGTEQREHILKSAEKLKDGKKYRPSLLMTTATPIPGTLGQILFGGVDLIRLNNRDNRAKIQTFLVNNNKRLDGYEWLRKKIQEGGQAYIVCPAVNETQEKKSVLVEHKKLKEIFLEFNIGLLYGSLSDKQKNQVVSDFKEGKINMLVTTTVIEVGIDNPNANIIIIEDANNYGLAQLHQLRGRVGRGSKDSYCLLFYDSEFEILDNNDPNFQRLHFFSTNMDGNIIAEYDLKMRGAGDIYGKEQSGLMKFKIADVLDQKLLNLVKTSL